MVQAANLKIIDTTETFLKLRSAGLNHHLPKLSFFSLTLTVQGLGGGSNKPCLLTFSFFKLSSTAIRMDQRF